MTRGEDVSGLLQGWEGTQTQEWMEKHEEQASSGRAAPLPLSLLQEGRDLCGWGRRSSVTLS